MFNNNAGHPEHDLIKHSGESWERRKLLSWTLKEALAERVGGNEMKSLQGQDSTSLDLLEDGMATKRPIR